VNQDKTERGRTEDCPDSTGILYVDLYDDEQDMAGELRVFGDSADSAVLVRKPNRWVLHNSQVYIRVGAADEDHKEVNREPSFLVVLGRV
jgi:hypothetical protein